MGEAASGLNQRIAERVRELRAAQGLSLDALATKSSVSRSMISLVERGESSPAAGYLRRNVSPPGVPQPMQLVEVHFPPGRRVAFEAGSRDVRVHQQVWVLEGAIDVTLGVERHRLREGDCLAMQLDRPTMFHNPTRKRARYAVVIASDTPWRR